MAWEVLSGAEYGMRLLRRVEVEFKENKARELMQEWACVL